MRSPSYLALLSFCLLSFLPACAQEEPLLEAKSSLGTAAEPLIILCMNGTACTSTKGSCSGTGICNSSGTCVVSSWCNDNNVCTTDSCVSLFGNYLCSNAGAPSSTSCNDNSACTNGDHCNGSGTCIGGSTVNCADTNPCTNDGCNAASGCTHTNTSSGTSCTDSNACTSGDVCNGYGSCVGSTVVCNDGNSCTTDTCNTASGCVYTFLGVNYSCNDNLRCTTNDRCNASQQCVGTSVTVPSDGNPCTFDQCDPATGNFVYPPNNGASCSDNNACTVLDACYEGTCVGYSRNCDDSNACTNDSCVPQTGCVYTAVVCTDTNPCTDNACLPASGCSVTFSSPATSCNDGDLCTTGDHCNGSGSCISTPVVPDDDNNFCTLDICNPAGPGTLHSPTNQGLACNDNNACTTTSTCNNGICVGGASLNCDDSNVCTTDSCNISSGCVHGNAADTVACNDNDGCTNNDHCTGTGTCTGYTSPPVDDYNPCTQDICNSATGITSHPPVANGTSCNDYKVCTDPDTCTNGTCGGTTRNCSDNNACTTDSCDTSSGCVNTAIVCNDSNQCTSDSCDRVLGCVYTVLTGALCNDGNACTTGETCNSSKVCGQGTPVVPQNDNNFCTLDLCVSATGLTSHTPTNQGLACDDGNACTTTSSCDNGTCVGGPSINCADNNSCTTDTCNPASGCVHTFNGVNSTCDDNLRCTTNDKCNADQQCVGSAVVVPPDANPCTFDQCDPLTGNPVYPFNNGASCNDGNACTESDTCFNGGCTNSSPVNCNDNDACTTDSCNTTSGCAHEAVVCVDSNPCTDNTCLPGSGCSYPPSPTGTSCNDGDLCTTGDHCDGTGACASTLVIPQNDNNFCTADLCVSATGLTSHTPTNQGLACEDNNACTVTSACSLGVCQGVSWLNCNDNNVCTDDSCNPATGCSPPVYNTVACNDNNGCTLDDHCNGAGVCTGMNVSVPLDFDQCTDDICNPTTGAIEHPISPNGTACNDADPCTTSDSCQAGICGGTAVICTDNDLCTTDSCVSGTGCKYEPKNCSGTDACKVYGCNTQTGCTEAPRNIDDLNSCTTDICDPWAGQGHLYLGDGTPCDDGNATTQEDFCGENLCKAGLSCQPAVLTTVPQPPPVILRRRLGRGRHVVATSDKGQAVVFIEELTGDGGSVQVGVATFTASGVRTGVVKWGKVPFYADPVIAALPNGDYVVAFDSVTLDGDGLAVGLVKVSSVGQLLTQPILANATKVFGQHSADITWTGSELRMAWEDESEPGHRKLCQRRFNADLSPLSGEDCGISAPEYDRSRVSLTTVGQTPVTAWQETWQETFEPFNTKRRVQLQFGSAQVSFDITAAPQDESPALAELDASHVLMVYPDTDGTQRAVVVNSAGAVVDNAALNEPGEPRYTPVLTKIGEQVYMAWMSPPALLDGGWDPDLDDVFAQKLAWNSNVLDLDANAKFPIPFSESYRFGDQRNPAIAARLFSGKNAMWAVWEDFRDDKTQTSHGDVLVSIRVLP